MNLQHLNLEITRLCNQGCVYCFNESSPWAGKPQLEAASWLTAIRRLRPLGLRSVHVTGGEPFVWAGTPELLRGAQAAGVNTSILSNGTGVAKALDGDFATMARLTVGQISLDSLDPEVHDRRRGRNGAWRLAVSAIERLSSAGVPVEISCTVSEENLGGLPDLLGFAESRKLHVILRPLVSVGRAAGNSSCSTIEQELFERARASLEDSYPGVLVEDRFHYVPTPGAVKKAAKTGIATVLPDGRFRDGAVTLRSARFDSIRPFLEAA